MNSRLTALAIYSSFSDRDTVLGREEPSYHDLSCVNEGLRSHSGRHEATVPMIIDRPLISAHDEVLLSGRARNYDLYDMLCNGLA